MQTNVQSNLGTIFVDIDKCSSNDLIIATPQPGLKVYFNTQTGGLIKFQVDLGTCVEQEDSIVQYNDDEDTLYINLTEENQKADGLCDLIYIDRKQNILISANRNTVGNLVGLEIVGLSRIVD